MVKGVSRRVVIVQSPDSTIFEQAIFIVKDQSNKSNNIMHDACLIAEQYLGNKPVKKYVKKRFTGFHLFISALLGAGIVSSLWFLSTTFSVPLF